MQYTFTEEDVEQSSEGDIGDFDPKEMAMEALRNELKEHIGNNYPINDLVIETDFDSLLGIMDSDD